MQWLVNFWASTRCACEEQMPLASARSNKGKNLKVLHFRGHPTSMVLLQGESNPQPSHHTLCATNFVMTGLMHVCRRPVLPVVRRCSACVRAGPWLVVGSTSADLSWWAFPGRGSSLSCRWRGRLGTPWEPACSVNRLVRIHENFRPADCSPSHPTYLKRH